MENIYNICKYIVKHESEQGRAVTNLRLQKLLYFIQAYSLHKLGRKSFCEKIVAWQYGPVVIEAYREYKFYGSLDIIPSDIKNIDELVADAELRTAINETLKDASHFSTPRLIDITHLQNPWIDAYDKGKGHGAEITEEALRLEFCEK